MRVHWLQHAADVDLGCIAPWLAARGHAVTRSALHAGEPLPRLEDFDRLLVMGGPMNIYQERHYPWLRDEKAFLRAAVDGGKQVLAICLGAQLLADVLGGPVRRSAEKEIGWFDVRLTEAGRRDARFAGVPAAWPVFHWHGDTYALPPGATRIFESEACAEQGFAYDGGRVLALQFHAEVTAVNARDWALGETLPAGRYVQTAEEMQRDLHRFAQQNRLLLQLLDRFDTPRERC